MFGRPEFARGPTGLREIALNVLNPAAKEETESREKLSFLFASRRVVPGMLVMS